MESNAIKSIPINDSFENAIDLIHNSVHVNSGKVIVSGMGKAGQVGINIATTLSSTGTPSIFVHPSEAQHGDLGVIQKNDICILLSNSGKTREVIEFIHLAKTLHPKIKFITISSDSDSEICSDSDVTLCIGSPEEICPLGLTPTISTTRMMVIGDILVTLMMEKINFTKEEYSKRHHGGYLGLVSKM